MMINKEKCSPDDRLCRVYVGKDGLIIETLTQKYNSYLKYPVPEDHIGLPYIKITLKELLKIKGNDTIEDLYFDGDVIRKNFKNKNQKETNDDKVNDEAPKKRRSKKSAKV